jgi:hypothetical protein
MDAFHFFVFPSFRETFLDHEDHCTSFLGTNLTIATQTMQNELHNSVGYWHMRKNTKEKVEF